MAEITLVEAVRGLGLEAHSRMRAGWEPEEIQEDLTGQLLARGVHPVLALAIARVAAESACGWPV